MGPTWGPPGSCRPQMGPVLAAWTLLSGLWSVPIHRNLRVIKMQNLPSLVASGVVIMTTSGATVACMAVPPWQHYNDVMGAMASHIISLTIVYSTVYSGADQRKQTSKLRVTGLCTGNSPGTGEFPAQMASNAESVSIWWRHHEMSP